MEKHNSKHCICLLYEYIRVRYDFFYKLYIMTQIQQNITDIDN